MAFYIVHAGTSLQIVRENGTIYGTLTPPSGVTISATRPARFATLSRRVVITNAPSQNLWLDPLTFTLYKLAIAGPSVTPTASVGVSTGLTGAYSYKYSFIQKIGGILVNESPISAASNTVTLANQTLAGTIPVSADTAVTGRRVYRTVVGGAIYLFAFDVADNTTTTFDNGLADAGLGDAAPTILNAPAGTVDGTYLTLITEWKNRLWARADGVGLVDQIQRTEVDTPYQWVADTLPANSLGEDETGITGFVRRQNELGIGKRNRILKVVGTGVTGADGVPDWEVIVVSEETGILSADSIQVIRDIGYFLGIDGVYAYGSDGVVGLSRGKVDPWFTTPNFFTNTLFETCFGGYNARTDTYDLHLGAVGATTFNRWVSLTLQAGAGGKWLGPHLTTAFTPTCRATFRDAYGGYLPVVGGADGFIYLMNQSRASDLAGSAPSVGIAIGIDWITAFLNGGDPDLTHMWNQPTVLIENQGVAAGSVTVFPRLGDTDAVDGTSQPLLQQTARVRLFRWGAGRLLALRFTHAIADEDVQIYGWEQPVVTLGRR